MSASLHLDLQGTVTVIGGDSAVTRTLDRAASWRAAGNRIFFIGHFKTQTQARAVQGTLEMLTDQAIWILDQGPELILKRKQDRCFVYGVDEFLDACAETDGAHTTWMYESDYIILLDHPDAMQQFSVALQTRLKPRPPNGLNHIALGQLPWVKNINKSSPGCLTDYPP